MPLNAGVASFVDDPFAGVTSETTGGVVSMVNVLAVLEPVLPAESVWVVCAV